MGVGPQGDTKRAGQAKVGKLQVALLVNEQVLRLQVAMQDAVAVAVSDAGAELLHELFHHGLAESEMAMATVHAALGQRLALTTL